MGAPFRAAGACAHDCGGGDGRQEARKSADGRGGLVVIGAFIWWFSFYSSLQRELATATGTRGDSSVFDALSCLYSSSGACGLVAGIATIAGRTVYEPTVFWVGAIGLVAGILIRVTAKPAGPA